MDTMNIGTEVGFCASTANLWQFIGQALLVVKILIPAALIIIGIITLGKAIISDDDKDAKKSFSKMIVKFIAAVVIFFLPNIITALFNAVNGFGEVRDDYLVCKQCINSPRGEACSEYVDDLDNSDMLGE